MCAENTGLALGLYVVGAHGTLLLEEGSKVCHLIIHRAGPGSSPSGSAAVDRDSIQLLLSAVHSYRLT